MALNPILNKIKGYKYNDTATDEQAETAKIASIIDEWIKIIYIPSPRAIANLTHLDDSVCSLAIGLSFR